VLSSRADIRHSGFFPAAVYTRNPWKSASYQRGRYRSESFLAAPGAMSQKNQPHAIPSYSKATVGISFRTIDCLSVYDGVRARE